MKIARSKIIFAILISLMMILSALAISASASDSNTYQLSYDANGGSSAPPGKTVISNAYTNLSTLEPVLLGRIFLGWSTQPTSGSTLYQRGEWIFVDSDMTLYAIWDNTAGVVKHTVKFNYTEMSGWAVLWAPEIAAGLIISEIYEDYNQWQYTDSQGVLWSSKWYTDADRTELYDFTAPVTKSLELYASWQRVSMFTLSYDANGGSGAPPAKPVIPDAYTNISTTVPVRAGAVFLGWNTYPVPTAPPGDRYQPGGWVYINEDTTLRAVWSTDEWDLPIVSFNYTEMSGWAVWWAPAIPYGESVQENYGSFNGWEWSPDGGVTNYIAYWFTDIGRTQLYDFEDPVTYSFTLYSQWTLVTDPDIEYTVKYLGTSGEILFEEIRYGKENEPVAIEERDFAGYEFDAANAGNVLSDIIAGDGSSVLVRYYTPDEDTEYAVKYLGTTGEVLFEETRDGETYELVSIEARDFAGYEFDEDNDGNVLSARIKGDGTTVLVRYYIPYDDTEYTVKYLGTTGEVLFEETRDGETYELVSIEARDFAGYEFDEDNDGNILSARIKGDGTTVLVRYYIPNDDTEYTVKYLGTTGEVLFEETRDGETYELVSIEARDFAGYEFDGDNDGNVLSARIKGDGTTVLVRYYIPDDDTKYTVKYLGITGEVLFEEIRNGETYEPVSIEARDFAGYEFDEDNDGNVLSARIKGDGTTVLVRYYIPNDDTEYAVKYLGTTGELLFEETRNGETYELVSIEARDFAGYEFDEDNDGNVLSARIKGDGTTVLVRYYIPNDDTEYTVRYLGTTGEVLFEETRNGETYELVSIEARDFSGYEFDEDNADNILSGRIKGDGSAILVRYYIPNQGTAYMVRYLDTTGEVLFEETRNGETYELVSIEERDFAEYDFDEDNEGNVLSARIKGDGSTVLVRYYTQDKEYMVRYLGTTGEVLFEEIRSGGAYEPVSIEARDFAGYEFDAANAGNNLSDTIASDGSTVLVRYYIPNDGTEYTVRYLGTTGELLFEETRDGRTYEPVSIEARDFAGYEFDEDNDDNVLSARIKGDGTTVLLRYYIPNDDTEYTVKYLGTTGEILFEETRNGETYELVSIEARDFAGYEFDGDNDDNVLSARIKGNGLTVLVRYYTPNEDTPYTVYHIGTGGVALDTEYLTGTTYTTAYAVIGTFSGYTFDEFNAGNVLSGTISGDGLLELYVYYRGFYTITWNTDVGDPEQIVTDYVNHGASVSALTPPPKTGFTFQGWYDDEDFGLAPYGEGMVEFPLTANSDMEFWARWRGASYNITFYRNRTSSDNTTQTQPVRYHEAVTLRTIEDTGYTHNDATRVFMGWATSRSGPVVFGDGEEFIYRLTEPLALYAVWGYTVTFNQYNTAGTNPSANPLTVVVEPGTEVEPPDVFRLGYTFTGWYTGAGPSGGSLVTFPQTVNASATYHARWSEIIGVSVGVLPNHCNDYVTDNRIFSNVVSANTDTRFIFFTTIIDSYGRSTDFTVSADMPFETIGNKTGVLIPADYEGDINVVVTAVADGYTSMSFTLAVSKIEDFVYGNNISNGYAHSGTFICDSWEWRLLSNTFGPGGNNSGTEILVLSEHLYQIARYHSSGSCSSYMASSLRTSTLTNIYNGLTWAQEYAVLPNTNVGNSWGGRMGSTNTSNLTRTDRINGAPNRTTSSGIAADKGPVLDGCFLLSHRDVAMERLGGWPVRTGTGRSTVILNRQARQIHSTIGYNAGVGPTANHDANSWWQRGSYNNSTGWEFNYNGGTGRSTGNLARLEGVRPAMILRFE